MSRMKLCAHFCFPMTQLEVFMYALDRTFFKIVAVFIPGFVIKFFAPFSFGDQFAGQK